MDSDELGERMTALAEHFPSMRGAPGIDPWTPHELNRWAVGQASHGERHTARFLLAVWDPGTDWEAGGFDVLEALRVWDLAHRAAFLECAADPWWP
jgi:hypothetical protein